MELGKLPRGNCATCGKEIPIPDIRNKKPQYCSRTCAAMGRFRTRYRGTNSGPMERPDLMGKLKEKW